MVNNLLNKLATLLMATTIAFTPITAGCESCATPDNNNDPGIEDVGGNGNENQGNENSGNGGNENPTPEQHSALLNAVLNGSFYKNLVEEAKNLPTTKNHNKYQAIPYKYLEDKGYNVNKIKNNELRCESDVFLYNNELYIALKTEVEASTNYFDCQVLKYQISEQEIEDLNKMFVNTQKIATSGSLSTYMQAPFMIQQLSYLRDPVELLNTPAKITPEASDKCTRNIDGKNYIGSLTNSIYLGTEKVSSSYHRHTFMIFTNSDGFVTLNSKLGSITFCSDDSLSTIINNNIVYSNKTWDITYELLNKDKVAFEESIISVKMYNSRGVYLDNYLDEINNVK